MRKILHINIALLLAMTVTGTAWAAELGSIRGTVVDGSGKGLRGAIVSAIQEDEQKSISVLTDPEGRFILDRLPPTEYELRARLVGFDDKYLDPVSISAGDGNENAEFVLKPAKDLLRQREHYENIGIRKMVCCQK